MERSWRVGELAKAMGTTVRTLHFYEQKGLLPAPVRTQGKHRLYFVQDLVRIHQILAFKQLGFPLTEIGRLLGSTNLTFGTLVKKQQAHIETQLSHLNQLQRMLATIAPKLGNGGEIPFEEVIAAVKMMSAIEHTKPIPQYDKLQGDDAVPAEVLNALHS